MTNDNQPNDPAASPTNGEAVRSGDWLAEVEAALTNVNEAHGCVVIGRTHRAMVLLEAARKTLEKLV